MFIDTHCHVHDVGYEPDVDEVLKRAQLAGVTKMICVGTDAPSSLDARALAERYDNLSYSIGIHPHETLVSEIRNQDGLSGLDILRRSATEARASVKGSKLVGVGEIGLDYFYLHSPKDVQMRVLRGQLDLAVEFNLPVIFHVRDAFDDFWPIFDSYGGKLRGVLHSFTDSMENMRAGIERGLYIGVNGISTFTKDEAQKRMFEAIPSERLLLETDAPFLTPVPLRGKVNEPAFVKQVAEHHAVVTGLPLDVIARTTTANAHALFAL